MTKAGDCPFSRMASSVVGAPTHVGASTHQGARGRVRAPSPGPGAALSLIGSFVTEGVPHATLRIAEEVGEAVAFDNPVRLGGKSGWTFLTNPKDVEWIATSRGSNYRERFLPDSYAFATNGKGILATGGTYNKRHRSLCQPSFQKAALLEQFASKVESSARALAGEWRKALDRAPSEALEIDAHLHMQRLTLDIIGATAFSHDFGQVALCGSDGPQKASALVQAVNDFGQSLSQVFITPVPLLRVLEAARYPSIVKLRGSLDTIHASMGEIIEKRRESRSKDRGRGPARDLLDSLMEARDDNGRPMTTEELLEDVHDIMGAGHETTATTLAAALYSVARHPEVDRKIRAELADVTGMARPVTYADLPHLVYLGQVIKEVLRLYPSIPIFPRVALEEDWLPGSGSWIPPNEVVFLSSYAMGRLGKNWERPLEFWPDHFSPEREGKRHKYTFVPFGVGARQCLGKKFALLSLTLVLGNLIQDFKFEPISPTTALLDIGFDITMNFDKFSGIRLQVSRI